MKLGEADKIVRILSEKEGIIDAVAKGIRKTKSKFGGRLEPFTYSDLHLYQGRNLDIILQAETINPFKLILPYLAITGRNPSFSATGPKVDFSNSATSIRRDPVSSSTFSIFMG
ncbi:DNA repair protein RecO (recombination protein O) [Candidatus Hakubella thermalkaliphila]|uniref:DNA repair protein RecO (Recombination protein O) n=1 Tax=Candidatus Hakubella thermalkaliphila TaxID=2754717 RepID=A0A6V8NUI8_9ACTN|nr:DNA repair protein RecO (recombination protein O) [Candidatus Hakubella thermalkaliphila]